MKNLEVMIRTNKFAFEAIDPKDEDAFIRDVLGIYRINAEPDRGMGLPIGSIDIIMSLPEYYILKNFYPDLEMMHPMEVEDKWIELHQDEDYDLLRERESIGNMLLDDIEQVLDIFRMSHVAPSRNPFRPHDLFIHCSPIKSAW